MTSFRQDILAERRLVLLKLLIEDGGQSNDGTLTTAMRSMGIRQGLDQAGVRQMLRELAERDCATIDMIRDTVMVAKITERGRMAAAGDIEIGGIAAPTMGL